MSYVFHMYTMEYHMHISTYAQQIVCDNAYRSAVYMGLEALRRAGLFFETISLGTSIGSYVFPRRFIANGIMIPPIADMCLIVYNG